MTFLRVPIIESKRERDAIDRAKAGLMSEEATFAEIRPLTSSERAVLAEARVHAYRGIANEGSREAEREVRHAMSRFATV